MKIALQHLDEEAFDVYNSSACRAKYDVDYYTRPPPDAIPVGDLPYSTTHITLPRVDHYPSFLTDILHRKVRVVDTYPSSAIGFFVKPADTAKRFPAHIIDTTKRARPKGPMYLSAPIKGLVPDSEVRHYVTAGKIVFEEADTYHELVERKLEDAPDFHGTIDIAASADGPTLIECDYPIATGWYGDETNIDVYLDWLVAGVKWVRERAK